MIRIFFTVATFFLLYSYIYAEANPVVILVGLDDFTREKKGIALSRNQVLMNRNTVVQSKTLCLKDEEGFGWYKSHIQELKSGYFLLTFNNLHYDLPTALHDFKYKFGQKVKVIDDKGKLRDGFISNEIYIEVLDANFSTVMMAPNTPVPKSIMAVCSEDGKLIGIPPSAELFNNAHNKLDIYLGKYSFSFVKASDIQKHLKINEDNKKSKDNEYSLSAKDFSAYGYYKNTKIVDGYDDKYVYFALPKTARFNFETQNIDKLYAKKSTMGELRMVAADEFYVYSTFDKLIKENIENQQIEGEIPVRGRDSFLIPNTNHSYFLYATGLSCIYVDAKKFSVVKDFSTDENSIMGFNWNDEKDEFAIFEHIPNKFTGIKIYDLSAKLLETLPISMSITRAVKRTQFSWCSGKSIFIINKMVYDAKNGRFLYEMPVDDFWLSESKDYFIYLKTNILHVADFKLGQIVSKITDLPPRVQFVKLDDKSENQRLYIGSDESFLWFDWSKVNKEPLSVKEGTSFKFLFNDYFNEFIMPLSGGFQKTLKPVVEGELFSYSTNTYDKMLSINDFGVLTTMKIDYPVVSGFQHVSVYNYNKHIGTEKLSWEIKSLNFADLNYHRTVGKYVTISRKNTYSDSRYFKKSKSFFLINNDRRQYSVLSPFKDKSGYMLSEYNLPFNGYNYVPFYFNSLIYTYSLNKKGFLIIDSSEPEKINLQSPNLNNGGSVRTSCYSHDMKSLLLFGGKPKSVKDNTYSDYIFKYNVVSDKVISYHPIHRKFVTKGTDKNMFGVEFGLKTESKSNPGRYESIANSAYRMEEFENGNIRVGHWILNPYGSGRRKRYYISHKLPRGFIKLDPVNEIGYLFENKNTVVTVDLKTNKRIYQFKLNVRGIVTHNSPKVYSEKYMIWVLPGRYFVFNRSTGKVHSTYPSNCRGISFYDDGNYFFTDHRGLHFVRKE